MRQDSLEPLIDSKFLTLIALTKGSQSQISYDLFLFSLIMTIQVHQWLPELRFHNESENQNTVQWLCYILIRYVNYVMPSNIKRYQYKCCSLNSPVYYQRGIPEFIVFRGICQKYFFETFLERFENLSLYFLSQKTLFLCLHSLLIQQKYNDKFYAKNSLIFLRKNCVGKNVTITYFFI